MSLLNACGCDTENVADDLLSYSNPFFSRFITVIGLGGQFVVSVYIKYLKV